MRLARLIGALFAHGVLAGGFSLIAIELAVLATPQPNMGRFAQRSQVVTAVTDEPLWGFLAPDGRWRLSLSTRDVDPKFLDLLVAYEDKRFYDHVGVDPLALLRTLVEVASSGRVVSGGSTLTMQVVRLLEPQPRTFGAKVDQILKAIKIERIHSKKDILEIYLALAPYGGNIEGLRAASLMYLGKEPKRLSFGEAALFTALPQSPEHLRPDRNPVAARAARDHVLEALVRRKVVDPRVAARAVAEVVPARVRPLTFLAPHLAKRALERSQAREEVVRSTVEWRLQERVERLSTRALAHLDSGVSIAIIVIRNRDTSVAAYLSGIELKSHERSGHVDLVQAIRSPGSTLKPFIYALAFNSLIVHPETVISDQAIDIGGYRPENSDGKFAGDLSARQSLIRSRNTSAVLLLEKIGAGKFLTMFREVGRPLSLPSLDGGPGLAVALGGVGISLEQLTSLYTAFPNDGQLGALRFRNDDTAAPRLRFLEPYGARATADVLADVPPPLGYARQAAADGGRRIGFKTGTSYGFRDAWAVGFDALHTVGIWVGRPDGASHLGAYGITSAAPLLLQVFDLLPTPANDVRPAHVDLGPLTSQRELPHRLIRLEGTKAMESRPLEVAFPRNGSQIFADRRPGAPVELALVAAGGKPPYRWMLAGVLQSPSDVPIQNWLIEGRGQFDVSVIDAKGSLAEASFWVE